MKLIGRRDFVRGLGLGAAAPLLSPLCTGMIRQAHGAPARKRFILVADPNGWDIQNDPVKGVLRSGVRSENDFDLPEALKPMEPVKSELMMLFGLFTSFSVTQHGTGSSGLNQVPASKLPGSGTRPGGPTIDRWLGQKLGASDPFPATVFAMAETGKSYGLHVAADGDNQRAPAWITPVAAYNAMFGKLVPGPGGGAVDVNSLIARDKSVLDEVCKDIERAQSRLAGFERQKLQHALDGCRQFETQLKAKYEQIGRVGKPQPPAAALDTTGLTADLVRGMFDIAYQAHVFGLTHVSHVAIMGNDQNNVPWSFLGLPYATHFVIMHRSAKDWVDASDTQGGRFDAAVRKLVAFKAAEITRFYQRLKEVPEAGGRMADNSFIAWTNIAGGKHHFGQDTFAWVTLGKAGGYFRAPYHRHYGMKQHANADLFVSIAQAMGMDTNTFGDPSICKGPLPGVKA